MDVEPAIMTYSPFSSLTTWQHTLYNSGPSVINGFVRVDFPVYSLGGHVIFKEISATMSLFQRNDRLEKINCNVPDFPPRTVFGTNDETFADVTIGNFRTYDCTSFNFTDNCIPIICKFEEELFRKSHRIEVEVKSHLNDGKFQHFENYMHSKFTPKFTYQVQDVPYPEMQYSDSIERFFYLILIISIKSF